jgi:hypothetical protein
MVAPSPGKMLGQDAKFGVKQSLVEVSHQRAGAIEIARLGAASSNDRLREGASAGLAACVGP